MRVCQGALRCTVSSLPKPSTCHRHRHHQHHHYCQSHVKVIKSTMILPLPSKLSPDYLVLFQKEGENISTSNNTSNKSILKQFENKRVDKSCNYFEMM